MNLFWLRCKLRILVIFSVCSLSILFSSCSSLKPTSATKPTDSVSLSKAISAEKQVNEASNAFRRGAFDQAISSWSKAASLYEQHKQPDQQCSVLIQLSQAYQNIGQYGEALKTLKTVLTLAQEVGDQALITSAMGYLGNAYIGMGQPDTAYQYLSQSLETARSLDDPHISAVILNNLGNFYASQKNYNQALRAYKECVTLSENTDDQSMLATALTNAAMAALRLKSYREAASLSNRALDRVRELEDSQVKTYGFINLALSCVELHEVLSDPDNLLLLQAAEMLKNASAVAQKTGDSRAASYALGYLGSLYETEGQFHEALQLTRRAIFAAQQTNAWESLYRWNWQAGRLLRELGKIDEAIPAYRLAVASLQSIRQEMPRCYGRNPSSFRQTAGSVYFELVDLLLRRASVLEERDKYEQCLMEARDAVELLKAFELRDYFRDDCVDAGQSRTTRLDLISRAAVIIYPILLQDRLELLVRFTTGLKRFSVKVDARTITKEVREFRRKLEKRTTREFLPHAQRLYDWLIRPLESDLTSTAADTLVFVPDGPLRTIPMSALHDGKDFLIRKYALAITPGLDLTDPRPIDRQKLKVLEVGLTEGVQGFPPLPYVTAELQSIQDLYETGRLINQDFLVANMENELKDEQFNIVHIASHGHFGSDVEKSYVLAFDGKLTIDRLADFVGLFRFRDVPLELLTLSACETAAGDDRAALGLAGVAIKAGARSAVATLWHINDPASTELIVEFYRQLKNPTLSRAVALQRAQLKLMNDPVYRHPGYWSPFLLINNWL